MITVMKKKIYIAPQVIAYDLNLAEIVCGSIVNIPIGPPRDELDAASRRNNDWEEYLKN